MVRTFFQSSCRRGRDVIAVATLLGCLLLTSSPCVFALDPALHISQYAHTAWNIRDGFFDGSIFSIAQTPDGYFWIGTEFGLLRFDGMKTSAFNPPSDQHLPSNAIWSLLAARDGTLWIGTANGLASWKDGTLTRYDELAGRYVYRLLEDHEGSVWAGTLGEVSRLCSIHKGKTIECQGDDGSLGGGVFGLYEDSKGRLWAGVSDGLWRWKPGLHEFLPFPGAIDSIQSFSEDDEGNLLIGSRNGIRRLIEGEFEAYPIPGTSGKLNIDRLLRDREGSLWIGTRDRGLVHVHQGRLDVFGQSDGLSSDYVAGLLEDREGTIWVVTPGGLDRFRQSAVATLTTKQGLSNVTTKSVLAGRDGSVWLGTNDGLNRWKNGEITIYRKRHDDRSPRSTPPVAREIIDSALPDNSIESLFEDSLGKIWVSTLRGTAYLENGRFVSIGSVRSRFVHAITQEKPRNIWISDQDQGLVHLLDGSVIERFPWEKLGRRGPASILVPDRVQGGLFLGFFDGGVSYFKDGEVRASYATADGLGKGRVTHFQLDPDGSLWVSTEGGLTRLRKGRATTLTSKNGLPCDTVHWTIEDNAHSFWLYMSCGLVRVARADLDAWAAAAEDSKDATIHATIFDSSDGVRRATVPPGFGPIVTKSNDGKLWFVAEDGASVIDPAHLPFNRLPPPVRIEQITAARKTYSADLYAGGSIRLPALIRDLEIDYTAYSLAVPEKIRFRYKLVNHDSDWQDVGNRRQAFYNDLPPGNYRFRVKASNNNGVWNEAGAFLEFSIAPAYYQTAWFRLSVVVAFLGLLAALYQIRLRQVARQFNARMEERTRIAQDLHDGLLQGCLSVSMQLNLLVDDLPHDLPATTRLIRMQQLMARVIDDGRNALRGLRVADPAGVDLEQAFYRVQKEVAIGEHVGFSVFVEGRPRALHPLIRDDVYRIGREAIVNAFRHANAQHIEVEIDYMPKALHVAVCDDGCGIDPSIVSQGREGHWGLSGMRERAESIGGRINVMSRSTAGTEVHLSVPAKVAFQLEPWPARAWLAKLVGKRL